MSRCAFSLAAERDLEEIADYVAADDPHGAVSFIRELRVHCFALAERPGAYRLREEFGPGVRVAVHRRYLILYAEREGRVVIERIVHGARDLGDHQL